MTPLGAGYVPPAYRGKRHLEEALFIDVSNGSPNILQFTTLFWISSSFVNILKCHRLQVTMSMFFIAYWCAQVIAIFHCCSPAWETFLISFTHCSQCTFLISQFVTDNTFFLVYDLLFYMCISDVWLLCFCVTFVLQLLSALHFLWMGSHLCLLKIYINDFSSSLNLLENACSSGPSLIWGS